MQTKHVPIRTCIATGVKKPKQEMVRVVRVQNADSPDFVIKVDPKGKERGRGASIDSTMEAFELAVKKHAIERALKLERHLNPEEVASLRKDFADLLEEREFRQGQKKVVYKVTREELEQRLLA
ncbi:MAG: YlxR family protein [Candidatus Doudnabacteria bacterium]|nr:YlxR family protein [Candidatus Doudnabacteria bacterium]